MTSFPKADVQNARARGRPDVCFWPLADCQIGGLCDVSMTAIGESGHSPTSYQFIFRPNIGFIRLAAVVCRALALSNRAHR